MCHRGYHQHGDTEESGGVEGGVVGGFEPVGGGLIRLGAGETTQSVTHVGEELVDDIADSGKKDVKENRLIEGIYMWV